VLETRGAGVWGGADFAAAKTRAAESVGAYDAGSLALAQQRLAQASGLLEAVERAAPAALTAQLAAGERALSAGQQELAAQAFDLAVRIDPRTCGRRSGRAARDACRAFCRCSRTPRTRRRARVLARARRTTPRC